MVRELYIKQSEKIYDKLQTKQLCKRTMIIKIMSTGKIRIQYYLCRLSDSVFVTINTNMNMLCKYISKKTETKSIVAKRVVSQFVAIGGRSMDLC